MTMMTVGRYIFDDLSNVRLGIRPRYTRNILLETKITLSVSTDDQPNAGRFFLPLHQKIMTILNELFD